MNLPDWKLEQVRQISTRLLEVLLAEFADRRADIVLVAIIDTGIKAAKVLKLSETNVKACDLLLETLVAIRLAEVGDAKG